MIPRTLPLVRFKLSRMKNKKLLYILIPAVIIIWGVIIWRIVSFTAKDSEDNLEYKIDISSDSLTKQQYILQLDYSDPFLGIKDIKTSKPIKNNGIKKVEISSLTPNIPMPQIDYFGLVECGQRKTGLITFKTKSLLIHTNENYEEIEILSMNEDSLKITFKSKVFAYGKIKQNSN